MAENIDIEAKLCSYVEGDLDAASRAEIERYLQAHPQYREVLAELISERGELRALPRVRAPMDVQENISGQLERSALLADGDLLRVTGRTSGFPYFRAWAAIIVLAAALSAVIYSVLPARKAKLNELATLTTNSSQLLDKAVLSSTVPADADATPNPTVIAMAAPATAAAPDMSPMAPVNNGMNNGATIVESNAKPTTQMQAAVAQIAMVSQSLPQLSDTPTTQATVLATSSNNQVSQQASAAQAVVLPTADLSAAESQVHQYLQSQNYSYATSVEHVSDGSVASNGSMNAVGGNVQSIAAPEVHTITVHQLTNAQLMQTRMAVESLPQSNAFMFSRAQTANRFQLAAPAPPSLQSSSIANSVAPMTLSPTTLPLGGETDLQPGQRIQVSAEDTGLGGVAAMDETMTIDPDGNIALPLIGKTRAAGMTPSALSRSIALSYEIAKSPTRATWTIRPALANAPTAESNKLELVPASAAFDAPQPAAAGTPMKAITVLTTQPSLAQQGLAANQTANTGQGGATLQTPAMVAKGSATTTPSNGAAALAATMPMTPIVSPTVTPTTMPAVADANEPRSDLTIVLVQTASPTTMPANVLPATTLPATPHSSLAVPATTRSPSSAR